MVSQSVGLQEALIRASEPLREKIKSSIALIQKAEGIALKYSSDGFYGTFSGGKDSQAIYHLTQLAGVKSSWYFSPTTVDPPQVLRFIRKEYPGVKFEKVQCSMYKAAIEENILPTQLIRWCCERFKENRGTNRVVIIGIRHEESTRRRNRGEVEVSNHKFKGDMDSFLEWRQRKIDKKINKDAIARFSNTPKIEVRCIKGKDSILISPIIEWTERDVWEFLNNVMRVPHCELYDMGHHRIGCILCPMSSFKRKIEDTKQFPHVKSKWIETIRVLMNNSRGFWSELKKKNPNITPEDVFNWWISGKKWDTFFDKDGQLSL